MGHEVEAVDIDNTIYSGPFVKFHHHLNFGPGVNKHNKDVLKAVDKFKPHLVLVDNKPFLKSASLRKIRKLAAGVKIVNLITDDPAGKYKYAWRVCLQTVALYDCHFVQRTINITELKYRGAQRVELCYRSFDPAYNRPVELTSELQKKYYAKVGFIGTYEKHRASFIAYLIQNNVPVLVTGNDWPEKEYWEIIKPFYRGPSVYGDEYIYSLNGMEIALHFLRHTNRDEQDSRTFEIPASKVFMIAERSDVHLQLFEEDKEAVYFTTREELLQKVNYYLEKPGERERIAEAGYHRSMTSGYDHRSRLESVIRQSFNAD